jgi:hypothetical protein
MWQRGALALARALEPLGERAEDPRGLDDEGAEARTRRDKSPGGGGGGGGGGSRVRASLSREPPPPAQRAGAPTPPRSPRAPFATTRSDSTVSTDTLLAALPGGLDGDGSVERRAVSAPRRGLRALAAAWRRGAEPAAAAARPAPSEGSRAAPTEADDAPGALASEDVDESDGGPTPLVASSVAVAMGGGGGGAAAAPPSMLQPSASATPLLTGFLPDAIAFE